MWLGVATHPAVKLLYGTLFIDHFICKIFHLDEKIISWHFQPVAILAQKQTPHDTRISSAVSNNPAQAVDHDIWQGSYFVIVTVSEQTVLQSHPQHHVLFTTKSHGLLTFEPRPMPIGCYSTLSACQIMDILPNQPSHIHAFNFSDLLVFLPKLTIIAECGTPLGVMHDVSFNDQKGSLIRIPVEDSGSSVLSAELHSNDPAVHYNAAGDKYAQMSCHTVMENDNSSFLADDWRHEIYSLDK